MTNRKFGLRPDCPRASAAAAPVSKVRLLIDAGKIFIITPKLKC
jgi:hypothetical protein